MTDIYVTFTTVGPSLVNTKCLQVHNGKENIVQGRLHELLLGS